MTMAEDRCNYGYENHTFSLEGIYSMYLFFTFPRFLPTFLLFGFIYSASSLKYSRTLDVSRMALASLSYSPRQRN